MAHTHHKVITLAAAAARSASGNSADVMVPADTRRIVVLLNITASAHEAGDTLDVFVDFSMDGVTYYNAGHFAQQAGNGAAKKEVMVLDPANPGTATFNVTTDCTAGVVKPAVCGPRIRERHALVDSGDADTLHTYSVVAYCE